jgi:NCS1 family nucleobase:cation symporter-1
MTESGVDSLAPIEPNARDWGTKQYAWMWFGIIMTPSGYITGSSMLSLGLSWWQATIAVFLASLVCLAFLCLNAMPGAQYGISFPVVARSCFGIHGAQGATISRGFVAIFWLSTQIWIGAQGIYNALCNVAPSLAGSADLGGGVNLLEFVVYLLFLLLHALVSDCCSCCCTRW